MDYSKYDRIVSTPISRRSLLRSLGSATALTVARQMTSGPAMAEEEDRSPEAAEPRTHAFATRGVVLIPSDLATLDWPARAKQAGLTTIATHPTPQQAADFLQKEEGQQFLDNCRKLGVEVEHELHAMSDFLPRSLFDKDPSMFRMTTCGRMPSEASGTLRPSQRGWMATT